MILNKKLPIWVFIVTVVAAIIAIVLITHQVTIALKDIRQTGLSIAEIGKDYCGVKEHALQRETADWQTYENKDFGVGIKYPENILYSKPLIVGGNCDYQIFPDKCPSIDNILIVNNRESSENLQNPNYWRIRYNKAIASSGNKFCIFSTTDAAAGTAYVSDYYMVVKNNQCVVLNLVVAYPNCQNYADETAISECEKKNDNKLLMVSEILSTFKFIK
jgi:hypothetical protein